MFVCWLVCLEEDFCLGEDGIDILFSILPIKYNWKPWILYVEQTRILKGGKKKADWLGPNKQDGSEFYGFSFYLVHPRLNAREVSNLEAPACIDQKISSDEVCHLVKKPEKG